MHRTPCPRGLPCNASSLRVRRAILPPARQRCKPPQAFEPHIGGPQLASASVVIASTVITGMYWWMVVVPSERATLAKSKRRGTMRQYLQELQEDPSREAERWFYADWLRQLEKRESKRSQKGTAAAGSAASSMEASSRDNTTAAAATAEPMASSTAAPSSDSMGPSGGNMPHSETQQPQQPQQPQQQSQRDNLLQPTERTPEPNFLSLDNPVVFTATLLGGLVALSVAFH
ncbi:hypothetical protein DUNSADRAFT_4968 [Dunaliella salina]|uniref:Transmembrane protein n=1 Tax=Dunaliella salina TaxID=3046 RepID=A0ABQ7GQV3_DUNSA|nr:hypothetical protein DUNSADRAFT_4968 [Dunaliella salina]|eukprot:KAF5836995.1 hypothetical protein DUNSADRAFT_4968 [Dunaliella salina]